ncbi:hypothetical protein BDN70DRAFT_172174 [Pholiota conissans]|uniref:Uncharacterized protein n=1 Tax=Pholiota conissans TaxID=109636 RepID=A0A9P6CXB6_9AGAR|nr:hypothetical protein BDN70DRAFT_172174 [Pholiota conissans]
MFFKAIVAAWSSIVLSLNRHISSLFSSGLFSIKTLSGCSKISHDSRQCRRRSARIVSTNQPESNVLLLCEKPEEHARALIDIGREYTS